MGCGASTGHFAEQSYAKFKADGEDKETLPLRSFYRAISNSFSDVNESRKDRKDKGVDVCPIINQNPYCCNTAKHKADQHKGMRTLEELIAGVFGANVGGIQRDENVAISLELWRSLCDGLVKVCKSYWHDEDRVKLTENVVEMCLQLGRPDSSWCKRVRCFCHFEVHMVEPKAGHPGGKRIVDGKFFFMKLESNSEEGELVYPAKPGKEWDSTPASWINYRYGKEDSSTEQLKIDVLEWTAGNWVHTETMVNPQDVFEL